MALSMARSGSGEAGAADRSGLMPIASAMRRSCSAAGGVCRQKSARAETCGSVTWSSM
jgi:hypothetical protein